MTEHVIQFCEKCAESVLKEWKGWPHKDPVPLLPKIENDLYNECGGREVLGNEQNTWLNYNRGGYCTGLSD